MCVLDSSYCLSRCPAVLHPFLGPAWIISTGSSWVWPMSSAGRRSKLAGEWGWDIYSLVEVGSLCPSPKIRLHDMRPTLCVQPSIYRFLQTLLTLISSGIEVIIRLPYTSLKELQLISTLSAPLERVLYYTLLKIPNLNALCVSCQTLINASCESSVTLRINFSYSILHGIRSTWF